MFQTFSGSSRRPRQVNLSGRTNNPFAAVQQSAAGPSTAAPGSGSGAIAHAQLERKARQQERDRLQASKKLQRVWRGHVSRRSVRAGYQQNVLTGERALAVLRPDQRGFLDVWQHLRWAVQATRPDARDSSSADSLLRAGRWVCEKSRNVVALGRDAGGLRMGMAPLRALVRLLLRFLGSALFSAAGTRKLRDDGELRRRVQGAVVLLAATLRIMASISTRDLHELRFDADEIAAGRSSRTRSISAVEQYYRILGHLEQWQLLPGAVEDDEIPDITTSLEYSIVTSDASISDDKSSAALRGLLQAPGGIAERDEGAYEALTTGLLTTSGLSERLLIAIRHTLDLDSWLKIVRHRLDSMEGLVTEEQQPLLANTIYLCNTQIEPSMTGAADTTGTKTESFSTNLSFLAILTRALRNYSSVADLETSTHDQLKRLVRADTIAALFRQTDWITSKEAHDSDSGVLADYILTVLRLLPSQADEVRMWIYLSNDADRQPALRLFWTAMARSHVFDLSCHSWREAAEVLPDRALLQDDLMRQKRSEWKIILLFLELYSFALRIQDDEQLVNGLNAERNTRQDTSSTLRLEEMKRLVTFLKNLSYAVYTERNLGAEDGSSEARLHQARSNGLVSGSPGQAPADISMVQLKGATTALLRMIYERDSRRHFLPPQHFIMEQFETSTFIHDVFREQELKAQLEQQSEDSDEDTEMQDIEPAADREVMISAHTRRVQRQARATANHRRRARRIAMERAAPRVEILENMPFLVPFEARVQIFRANVEMDMMERRQGYLDPDMWRMGLAHSNPMIAQRELSKHSAELRREHVFEDAFNAFYKLGEGLKEPIKISFIGEEGIDGGGVTKEFLTSIIDQVFSIESPDHLFAENDQHELYPYPSALDEIDVTLRQAISAGADIDEEQVRQARRDKLQQYDFIGRIVGKCLYEGILVHIPLARFFITKWALTGGDGASRNESTFRPSINDLWDYDQSIYRSMLHIKNYPGDVREMGLDFTLLDEVGGGETRERVLKPGGAGLQVDNANRLIYIALVAKHYLADRQYAQTRAFLDGLGSIIKPTWLRMFNEGEIRVLLGGESKPIDVEDLRRNTVYGGVYQIGDDGQEHPTIQMFWELMHEMEDVDRRKLLQYTTSTPNAPLMGFSHLNPRFSIRDSMSDQGRLPTSSTCANLLKLPIYKTKALLRDKLMTAIHSNAGFDLS